MNLAQRWNYFKYTWAPDKETFCFFTQPKAKVSHLLPWIHTTTQDTPHATEEYHTTQFNSRNKMQLISTSNRKLEPLLFVQTWKQIPELFRFSRFLTIKTPLLEKSLSIKIYSRYISLQPCITLSLNFYNRDSRKYNCFIAW